MAALLSTARKWPRDRVLLFTVSASVLSVGHREKHQVLGLQIFFSPETSGLLPLTDLLGRLTMLETPIKLPSVMLLSWKKDPVDSVSKSDEESVEELREPVSKVLNDVDT